ncbi:MAG: sulfite exporter TauE/SafE family protein [Desulfobacteraceae bacterium]|jgi:uncharacterized membrane protein YfcA
MLDLSLLEWGIAVICALMIGFAKAGIPGSGILIPLFAAAIMPAKSSTGFVLPMLIMADILAIIYWRRNVEWRQLVRLLPWAWLGVFTGFLGMDYISDEALRTFIGFLVFILIGVSYFRNRVLSDNHMPDHWMFAAVLGSLAGFTSMMANAAGPVMVIYLLAMRLPKESFIGTSAWFFWIINLSKLPFSHRLDLINLQSFQTNLVLLPCIVAGGIVGIILVKRISQNMFNRAVQALAVCGALFLIFM